MTVTDEIKSRLDAVQLIGQYVPLKKSGRSYKGLCPFHSEKTPSFFVFPDSQNWRCFGACGEGGDIFGFIMKREGMDFPEALRYLAEMAGVELEPQTPQRQEMEDQHERLRKLLAEASLFFNGQLLNASQAAYARSYVGERGLTADTIRAWELGYAPPGWETTLDHLTGLGFTADELDAAGMVVVKDEGGQYDRFRDRLVIPIRDLRGNVVGFGARALAADATPKYLNSPQGALFDKSRLLFGLSHARRAIREAETAVIVEGYMDVMQAHQAGYANVIAQMGTALTESQLKLLSRYATRLILALDPDTAGQMATDRGREVIERVSKAAAEQAAGEGVWGFDTAESEYHARMTAEFDARGMIRYESRLGFDIRVAVLPAGQDPDDLIRETPDAWANLIGSALPVVEYVIQTETAGLNLDDPKVKSSLAERIAPLIEDVANPVERSHYRQRLARLLRVDERALFAGGPTRRAAPRRPEPAPPDRQAESAPAPVFVASPTQSREAFCLAALIQHPRLIYQINRILAEYLDPAHLLRRPDLDPASMPYYECLEGLVVPGDFAHPEHQAIFRAWQAALEQDEVDPTPHLLYHLDPLIRDRVEHWLNQPLYAVLRGVTPPQAELSYDRILDEAVQGLLDLRMNRLSERIQEIEFRLAGLDNGGDARTITDWEGVAAMVLIAARSYVKQARDRYSLAGKRAAATEQARIQADGVLPG